MGSGSVSTVYKLVTDDAGRPLGEATVAFARSPVPVPDIAALTGPDGRFVLTAPGPGAYSVAVDAEGYTRRTVELQIGPNAPSEVHVEIRLPRDRGPAATGEEERS